MSDLRPHMSGVSGLLFAVGAPFLFVISTFLLPPVLAAEGSITESPLTGSPIEVESLTFNESPVSGSDDDETKISAVTEIVPFQEPIEENGDLSPGAVTAGMEGIESQYQLQLLQSEVMEFAWCADSDPAGDHCSVGRPAPGRTTAWPGSCHRRGQRPRPGPVALSG